MVQEIINRYYNEMIIFLVISIFVISIIWRWQIRRLAKPVVEFMALQSKNYFVVSILNKAPYNLRVMRVYKGRYWFSRKKMSIGLRIPNNEEHSDQLAKRKLSNVFIGGSDTKNLMIYLERKEEVGEKTFYFKTNAGACNFLTRKY